MQERIYHAALVDPEKCIWSETMHIIAAVNSTQGRDGRWIRLEYDTGEPNAAPRETPIQCGASLRIIPAFSSMKFKIVTGLASRVVLRGISEHYRRPGVLIDRCILATDVPYSRS